VAGLVVQNDIQIVEDERFLDKIGINVVSWIMVIVKNPVKSMSDIVT
jgi:hypothetical protein